NADFDGDQMAVHVPLSAEAQAEARLLMLSSHNLLLPASGRPVATPTQDMVIGCFYLTLEKEGAKGEGKVFASPEEVTMAYEEGSVALHARIKVRIRGQLIETTPGRVFFNEVLPEEIGFQNRVIDRKELGRLVDRLYRRFGSTRTAEVLDNIKTLGFRYATKSGTTVAVGDIQIPPEKAELIAEAERQVELVEQQHARGLVTAEERYQRIVDIWTQTKEKVTQKMLEGLGKFNPVYMMAIS